MVESLKNHISKVEWEVVDAISMVLAMGKAFRSGGFIIDMAGSSKGRKHDRPLDYSKLGGDIVFSLCFLYFEAHPL